MHSVITDNCCAVAIRQAYSVRVTSVALANNEVIMTDISNITEFNKENVLKILTLLQSECGKEGKLILSDAKQWIMDLDETKKADG